MGLIESFQLPKKWSTSRGIRPFTCVQMDIDVTIDTMFLHHVNFDNLDLLFAFLMFTCTYLPTFIPIYLDQCL